MTQRFEVFTATIAQIYRCIQKIKHMEMKELGLKGGHVTCLFYLGRHPEGLTASELCALCDEDKAAVSRTVADLEARGLVVCDQPAEGRRYRARLSLTEQGSAAASQVDGLIRQAVEQGGHGLTEGQRAAFYAALAKIAANLQAVCAGESEEMQG